MIFPTEKGRFSHGTRPKAKRKMAPTNKEWAMVKAESVVLEGVWEVMALAKVLRREANQVECDALVVRGVSARIADLASILIELMDGVEDEGRMLRRIRGE